MPTMTACPTCHLAIDPSIDQICPFCHSNFDPDTSMLSIPDSLGVKQTLPSGRSLIKAVKRPKIQAEIELAITVDRTGSSKEFKDGIEKTMEIIMNQLTLKARSVKCWLQSHGDLDCHQEMILHTDGGTPEKALRDMPGIPFGGGGDPEEHHLHGIKNLLDKTPWQDDPTRGRGAIIAFTTADSKPIPGVTPEQLGKQIADRGILLYLVSEPTPTLRQLVNAASGILFEISNNPDPVKLQGIGAKLAASIAVSVNRGSTIPITSAPDFPHEEPSLGSLLHLSPSKTSLLSKSNV